MQSNNFMKHFSFRCAFEYCVGKNNIIELELVKKNNVRRKQSTFTSLTRSLFPFDGTLHQRSRLHAILHWMFQFHIISAHQSSTLAYLSKLLQIGLLLCSKTCLLPITEKKTHVMCSNLKYTITMSAMYSYTSNESALSQNITPEGIKYRYIG